MPFKIVYTKLWGSPRPIAKKTDLMSVHSGALVATFVNNLVYTYKCDNYLETARHLVISLYGLQVSRSLKTRKAIKSGLQCTTFFSQILCLQVSVLIIHGHCIQLSFSRAQLSKKFICILSVSLDFFPDLLFYTKIAFRFLEKETLGIAVFQSNGVTNIITVFKSYKHVSRTFLESN